MKVGDLLKVTRDDIQDFPGDTTQLIMDLQKEGWRAQRSNRNHVMLLAPDGVTKYSASRNANSAKYLREDIARYNRGDKEVIEHPEEEEAAVPAHEKFPCPHSDCIKFYASQEKLNVHIAVDHDGWVKCPDCDEVRATTRSLSHHRRSEHGYVSPRYKQRKAQEANREAKKVQDEVIATVDEGHILTPAPDGMKFDTHFTDRMIETTVVPVEDVMVIGPITPEQKALKEAAKDLYPDKLNFGVIEGGVTEFDPPLQFNQYVKEADKKLDAAEIYRQTRAQLSAGEDVEVVRTADIEFIDSRDSWVLDHYEIANRRIGTLEQILDAVGLRMEIRVWKPKD